MSSLSKNRVAVLRLCAASILTSIGIMIPMFSPIRIVIEPASYTLASHVVIFLAMFISPGVAVMVTLGTSIGFFLGGFPIIIVLRACSHIVFVIIGSLYLQKIDKFAISGIKLRIFSFVLALFHAVAEFIVVLLFWFGIDTPNMTIANMLILVGLGTIMHSMVDLEIANIIRLALQRQGFYLKMSKN